MTARQDLKVQLACKDLQEQRAVQGLPAYRAYKVPQEMMARQARKEPQERKAYKGLQAMTARQGRKDSRALPVRSVQQVATSAAPTLTLPYQGFRMCL